MKLREWIEAWAGQYAEDLDNEVWQADIRMVLKADNGELNLRVSEYRKKGAPEKITIVSSRG